jgi:hypothetical protein
MRRIGDPFFCSMIKGARGDRSSPDPIVSLCAITTPSRHHHRMSNGGVYTGRPRLVQIRPAGS